MGLWAATNPTVSKNVAQMVNNMQKVTHNNKTKWEKQQFS